jgi:hypothetical protein
MNPRKNERRRSRMAKMSCLKDASQTMGGFGVAQSMFLQIVGQMYAIVSQWLVISDRAFGALGGFLIEDMLEIFRLSTVFATL